MRLKKGFTLAEILIVLMVIGVIATMTIPGLMKGVTEAQLKTGYKKGLNTIVNLAAMERISGSLATIASSANSLTLFESLNSNLSVSSYVDGSTYKVSNNAVIPASAYIPCVTVTDSDNAENTFGSKTGSTTCITSMTSSTTSDTQNSAWIVTEDNLAYTILRGGATDKQCLTKLEINGQDSQQNAVKNSCNIVIVDVNGLSKGPNSYDSQIGTAGTASLTSQDGLKDGTSVKMNTLVGDQYPIFLGSDGATAGPKAYTVTGRIAADLK